MSETPNTQQDKLINSLDGLHLVDAGAGTGKTFTISRRYANLLTERDVEPDDILLITFTRNAAEEMKERIINNCPYDQAALRDAPIQTFHGLCNEIVTEYGVNAPEELGIDETISPYTQLVESTVLEQQLFSRFLNQFIDRHPEHDAFYKVLWDETELLDLIHSLAAKGIFPTQEGWYQDGEAYLDGDRDAFMQAFDAANASDGNRQSDLRSRLSDLRDKTLPDSAPARQDIRGSRGTKQIDQSWAAEAFDRDQSALKSFLHDLYIEYITYALQRNYLNFSFLQMFAYVLLSEDHTLRTDLSFDYVMVDEFQDTSEIQFKLTLLFANTNNICVVGDWKQSIYSFQYASVDNIRQFEDRLDRYVDELNEDHPRITYPVEDVTQIPLETNYRSTEAIIDTATTALTIEATNSETVDAAAIRDDIVELDPTNTGPTEIAALTADDEIPLVLERIQELVDNPDYTIEEDDEERTLSYDDIGVLVRTRDFGLDLQQAADDHNIPAAYEGGIELFTTNPAILLLAWLRILHHNADRGWAVVLEHAGYTLDEADHILDEETYPENMLAFKEELQRRDGIGAIARTVFNRYGMHDAVADTIVTVLQNTFDTSYMNLGQIVRFIEDNIEEETTYEVDTSTADDMVTIQTIHKAKGLQYPAVIIADLNQSRFPNTNSSSAVLDYQDPIGLFQRKEFHDGDLPYVYDNWKAQFLTKCLSGDYDEERRLFYVSMTRAENYLTLTAETGNQSNFFTDIPVDAEEREPDPATEDRREDSGTTLELDPVSTHTPITLPVNALVELEETDGGRGPEFGTAVHRFAESYAQGDPVSPGNDDERHVKRFIDSLDGDLLIEQNGILPLDLDDRRVTLRGTIDLIQCTDSAATIIDFKTVTDHTNEDAYRIQLSAYYHMLQAVYPDREIKTKLFYTVDGTVEPIDPLDRASLQEHISTE